jgi:hypothetical protein
MNHPPRFTPLTLSPATDPAGVPPGSVYHDDNPLTGPVSAKNDSRAVVDHILGRLRNVGDEKMVSGV